MREASRFTRFSESGGEIVILELLLQMNDEMEE